MLKALRKGPEERYLTAVQLAADVQAYLDGRTVTARRGTLRYRAGKFIRRHRIALLGAGLVLASLTAGVGGSALAGKGGQRGTAQGRGPCSGFAAAE